jgi:hypothetical protein
MCRREDFAVTKLTLVAAFAFALPLITAGLAVHPQQALGQGSCSGCAAGPSDGGRTKLLAPGGCSSCVTDANGGSGQLAGPGSGNGLTDPACRSGGCVAGPGSGNGLTDPRTPPQAFDFPDPGSCSNCVTGANDGRR